MPVARIAEAAPPDGTRRLLAGARADRRPYTYDEHIRRYGRVELGDGLIDVVLASGLRGRGGGAFPTGLKLRAVAEARRRPVVVVNGAEGEPASRKDKALLRAAPHLVLDGAVAAASAVGAREIVVAVARSARIELAAVRSAVAERRDRVEWRLAQVPDAFVAGEETALLAGVSGRPAKPTTKPPYPFERGLGGAPTLVQNVETLAHLALVVRFGASWFRSLGTSAEPGTALVTVSGAVARPGVYEIELGTRLADAVEAAGGETEAVDAFLVGGYFGGWTRDPGHRLLAEEGLGAGVVVALPASSCALREASRVAAYLSAETAGQCGPCVHGLEAVSDGLALLADAHGGDPRQLARWARQIAGRGACRHPDGVVGFVRSTLAVMERDVARHARGAGCGRPDRGTLPTGGLR